MTGAPTAGLSSRETAACRRRRCRRRCARSASTRTSISRCRSTRRSRDEAGTRRSGSATTSARRPVVLGVRLLRLPDAVHAGAQRADERRCGVHVARRRARTSRSSLVSFDPRETPALAAAKKAEYLQRYERPGAAAGWHFLTGDAAVDRAPDAGGRLPLRLGRADASSSRTRPASSC